MTLMLKTSLKTTRPSEARHLVVFRREDMCANWPFVGGLWRWDDGEIAVSFSTRKSAYRDPADINHGNIEHFGEQRLARSLDDGETWLEEQTQLLYRKSEMYHRLSFDETQESPVRLDYSDPDRTRSAERWAHPLRAT